MLPTPLTDALTRTLGARMRRDEPLARHTSYRIGGPADALSAHGVPVQVLGGGSNVLVGDGGMRGVVVKLGRGFRRTTWRVDGVVAGAAVQMGRLAREAATRGLAGIEHAEGIPGTVGGACAGNAGAYGGDLAGVLEFVDGIARDGTPARLPRAAVGFAYRRAALPPGFLVTGVGLTLRPEEPAAVLARLEAARGKRTASQPQGEASAGSIFKNPPGDTAGRLIDAAGLKGRRVGRARISERHGNWIVNAGGAQAADVAALMTMAQRAVWERSGVWLEPEVKLVGTWH
jgi:UDP-N-acetylmuramate dehydrogenase